MRKNCELCGRRIIPKPDNSLCKSCFDYLWWKYDEKIDEKIIEYELEAKKGGKNDYE